MNKLQILRNKTVPLILCDQGLDKKKNCDPGQYAKSKSLVQLPRVVE